MDIRPFTIRIEDDAIADLKRRLAATRWPDMLAHGWEDGADLAFMRRLSDYWQDGFDWRAREAELNQLPQFMAEVDGQSIHFVHQPGTGPAPFPLVLTHGWPGSFVEMEAIVPLLADPAAHGGDPADAFDVVVPSLPGYGFSGKPREAGMTPRKIADLWAALMTGLGYARFGAQGGDWGASVTTWLAHRHAHKVVGLHLNFVPGSYKPPLDGPPLTSEEKAFIETARQWIADEGGYSHMHGTKPSTLAHALADSPVGLAAWIAEKFHGWSDCDGDIEGRIGLDALLANISLYWFTNTIGSSIRLYRENRLHPLEFAPGERVTPPLGVSVFPKEIVMPPRSWVERAYNVTRWTPMPRGGHFAALEQPELLADEIRAFFRPLRAR